MSKFCGARGSTGEPCRRKILDHQVRCRFHGGASPQARAKAEGRLALSELLSRELEPRERRDVWAILADCVQRLDHLVTSGDYSDNPAAYVELIEKTIRAAKVVIDSGAMERMTRVHERNLEREARFAIEATMVAVDALLDHLPVPLIDQGAYRTWALAVAHAKLAGEQPPELALPSAAVVAQVVAPRVVSGDLGASAARPGPDGEQP